MKYDDSPDWGSHVLALAEALARTKGPVIEFGAGLWSTNWLAVFCKAMRREFITVENDMDWLRRVKPAGVAEFTNDITSPFPLKRYPHWGVVFLDSGPTGSERWPVAIAALQVADLVLLHDWNDYEEHIYQYRAKVLPNAMAHVIDDRLSPATLVVTNKPEFLRYWPGKKGFKEVVFQKDYT